MAGRPASMLEERTSQKIVDVVLSMWADSEEELSFTEIHKRLVNRGIVQKIEYRYKTDRILKKLCKVNLIKKIGRGRYRLNVEPDEFKVFDYLQTLRQKSALARFRVGGHLWTLSQIYSLGMSQSVWEYEDAKYALEILHVRIAQLVEALKTLANEVERRGKDVVENKLLLLPPQVARQLVLELIPYYLGCKAGMDFDGLPLEELNMVLPEMIQSLPEEVTHQSPTLKRIIMEYFLSISRLVEVWKREHKNEEELLHVGDEEPKDFALIAIGQEHLIDESGSEKRSIRKDLQELSQETKSALHVASSLLGYSKENVLTTLDIYGRKYLGRQTWKETKRLYEKLSAADRVARIIDNFDCYDKKVKTEAGEYIQNLVETHGIKTLLFYLPFTRSRLNLISPTLRKEKILQKFFPQLPLETIHEWLREGAHMARKITDEKIDALREMLRKPSFKDLMHTHSTD